LGIEEIKAKKQALLVCVGVWVCGCGCVWVDFVVLWVDYGWVILKKLCVCVFLSTYLVAIDHLLTNIHTHTQAPPDLKGAVLVSGSLEEEVFTLLNEQRVWNKITAFAPDPVAVCVCVCVCVYECVVIEN
jgi:hypothetical protein